MNASETDSRIMKSRQDIAGWEAIGVGGRVEDALRMVSEEIAILSGLALAHPGKAAKIAALIGRYTTLQTELKSRAH